jgi:hypothetical protein
MPTKEMTLCRVKLQWRGEKVLNWKGENIFPVRTWKGFVAILGDPGKVHPFDQRQRVAQLALEDVVGSPEYQEKVGAKVISVEILGLVRVEEELSFPLPFSFPFCQEKDDREFDCPVPNCPGKMVISQDTSVFFVCKECRSMSTPNLIKQGIYMKGTEV